jgi:hypothetical protein
LQLPKQERAAWLQEGDITSSQANLTDVRLQSMPKSQGKSGNDMLLDGPIAWVRVPKRCEAPGSKGHAACVAKAVDDWQQQVSRRKLLQESAVGLMSDSLFNPTGTTDTGPGSLFATSAVRLVSLTPLKGSSLLATSNQTLEELSLQLQDALGKPVKEDISDASMLIVVSVTGGCCCWRVGLVLEACGLLGSRPGKAVCSVASGHGCLLCGRAPAGLDPAWTFQASARHGASCHATAAA